MWFLAVVSYLVGAEERIATDPIVFLFHSIFSPSTLAHQDLDQVLDQDEVLV